MRSMRYAFEFVFANDIGVSDRNNLHASSAKQKNRRPRGRRFDIVICLRFRADDQNVYFAVINTDQRWLGFGTPDWPSLICRFCGR